MEGGAMLAGAMLLAFSGAGGWAQSGVGGWTRETPRTLRLVWIDVEGVAPGLFDRTVRECDTLLAGTGFKAVWERAQAGSVLPDRDVAVVLLNSRPAGPGIDPSAMGAVKPDGEGSAVWVYLPNVAWALGQPLNGLRTPAQNRELAVALSHVVAHELVHVIAPDLPHASEGLLSGRLNRSRLVRERLELDPASHRGFVRRLAQRLGAPDTALIAGGARRPDAVMN